MVASIPVCLLAGCDQAGSAAPAAPAAPAPSSASPSGATSQSPERAAPNTPADNASCLAIEPGVRLGPVRIGDDATRLAATGLPVTSRSKHESSEIFAVGPLTAKLCGGKVVDVWLDDLRSPESCVTIGGKRIARDVPRDTFIARFMKCEAAPPRTGGAFTECEDGGVRIGYGRGDFMQVRVGKRGTRLDDTCEMLLDDGSPKPLAESVRQQLLQKVLDLDLLAGFWHRDRPGRDPLRVLETDVVKNKPKLTLFGSDVVYVPGSRAAPNTPHFEFVKLTSSDTRARVEFRYAVEGVHGHVTFIRRGETWILDEKKVAER